LEAQPAYQRFADVAARHAGPEALDLVGAYFVCGNVDELRTLVRSSGLDVTAIRTFSTVMRFDSTDEFVTTEVEATPLAERLDDDAYRRILEDSRGALSSFGAEDGVAIPVSGHVVTAKKR
jgi:hypothetical protein